MNQAIKKRKARKAALPKGVKVVPALKNKTLQQWIEGPDITTSGGCHTVHGRAVR